MKVLIAGDVRGNLHLLKKKVEALHSSKHGPFDLVFCVGTFFSREVPDLADYMEGKSAFPVPCYVVAGQEDFVGSLGEILVDSADAKVEICHNIEYLGSCGLKDVGHEKLRVAYVSADATKPAIERLSQQTKNEDVDFLLTYSWGAALQPFFSSIDSSVEKGAGDFSNLVDIAVSSGVTARYHFAGANGLYFKLPPYKSVTRPYVTRFVGLGQVQATKDKAKKWLHALTIRPASALSIEDLSKTFEGTISNPYAHVNSDRKRPHEGNGNGAGLSASDAQRLEQAGANKDQYFFKTRANSGGLCPPKRQKRMKTKYNVPARKDCWFCLASPTCEKHLIVSVARETYLCLPKGGISAGHLLIVPIAHHDSMSVAPDSIVEESERYKRALKKFFASHNEKTLIVERCVTTQGPQHHTYIEVIPMPSDRMGMVGKAFENESERCGIKFEAVREGDALSAVAPEDHQYIHVELCDGRKFIHKVHAAQREAGKVPLQFGRLLAAKALECPERTHWKSCVVPKDQEAQLTESFKRVFKPFDWTLQG